MAIRSLFLLGVILASVLLVFLDTAHARELTTANDLKGNVEPAIGPDGLKEKKVIIGIGVYPRRRGFGSGFQPGFGGFQPGFGGGFGGPGNGFGFGGGFRGPGNGFGFGGTFGGGFGGPGNGFGFGGLQPGFGGGF